MYTIKRMYTIDSYYLLLNKEIIALESINRDMFSLKIFLLILKHN